MEYLYQKTIDFIEQGNLIKKNDRILLSLSAGKDSMFLFHFMNKIKKSYDIDIAIFHLNHLMRGMESDEDEKFIIKIATDFDIKIFTERHDFKIDAVHGMSFEERARFVRYQLSERIADMHRYNKIATAHNKNDNIETVLMRIFTGTGIYGLQGIPTQRGGIIRPLLVLAADEISEYLTKHDIAWREDSTNKDNSFSRNYIRNEILPRVQQRFPMIANAVASLTELSTDTIQALDQLIDAQYPSIISSSNGDCYIDADRLRGNKYIFTHVLASVIREKYHHHPNKKMLTDVYSGYQNNRANMPLYADKIIRINKVNKKGKSVISISPHKKKCPKSNEWEYRIDIVTLHDTLEQKLVIDEIGISITLKIVNYDYFSTFKENNSFVFVTLDKSMESIYIRNRREGDRIITTGGTKKIKDLFIEKKLEADAKHRVPFLVANNQIIACMPGLVYEISNRIAKDFLVDKKSEKVLAVFKNPF